jgi:putative ABC transport system ATP-binding protein
LGYLLKHFELDDKFPALRSMALDEAAADWDQLGIALDMRLTPALLSVEAAAEAAGPQAVLLAELREGLGWLALHGFRTGRARVALIEDSGVEEQVLDMAEIAQRVGAAPGQALAWLAAQPESPLAAASSQDDHGHLPPLNRLAAMLRPERADLWLILGLATGSSLLALAPPVAVQSLVNSVAMGGMGQPLLVLSVILFLLLAFSGMVYVLESYLVELAQRRIFVRLAADLACRLPKVSGAFYDSQNGPAWVNRFFDVLIVQKAGSSLLLDGISLAMQTLAGLTLLAFYHPFLLAFDALLLLAIAFVLRGLGRGGVATAIVESKSKHALAEWLEDIARNPIAFKSAGGPKLAAERTDELAHAYLAAKRVHYRILLRQTIGSLVLYASASTALLALGGYLVIDGQLTLGQLVAAELIVSLVMASLVKFGKHVEGFYDLLASADKIGHLLDMPLERQSGVASSHASGPAALAIRGVSFGYGAKRPVLAGLDFSLRPGERVALLGGEGSGKTTLAQLLCGLREPEAGHIELDGMDLGHWRLDALRARVAWAGRVEILEGSVLENVQAGRSEVSQEQVWQLLESVGLTEDLGLPAQAATGVALGPHGAPLSSGQLARLMLARAMAGHPGLLVVDGLLDGLCPDALARLAPVLLADDAPWTLLLLTRSPDIAALCGKTIALQELAHA